MPDTANFGWTYPIDGGSAGAWGSILTTMFQDMDTDLWAVKGTADAALPATGGTATGQVELQRVVETAVNLGSITGATALNMNSGRLFYGTLTGNATLSFTNSPASGKVCSFVLEVTNGGAHTITWPSSVRWSQGSAPALTASGVDVLGFYTRDGGVNWRGGLGQVDSQ